MAITRAEIRERVGFSEPKGALARSAEARDEGRRAEEAGTREPDAFDPAVEGAYPLAEDEQ